jgi:gamma-glutamyltranspeptidase/glutathione hydrolase
VTTSLGAQFLVVDGTGINMNNRMRFMSLTPGDANQMTPGFKVRHTSNPYMVFRDGRLYMLGGNTGVDTQTQGQVQQFIAVVEFGMTAQQAVDRPRFVDNSFPASTYPYAAPNTLDVEPGFPANVVEDLRARGHTVRVGGDLFGNAGIIIISDDGTDADIGVEPRNETSSGVVIRP